MHASGRLFTATGLLTVAMLAPHPVAAAETLPAPKTYTLHSSLKPGDVARVRVMLEVGGNLKVMENQKPRTLPISVVANMDYEERIAQWPSKPQDRLRSVRYYDQADAVMQVDKEGTKPALRDARRLIGVEIEGSTATLFSPAGPMSREELDLVQQVPGNSLLLNALLPGEPVAQGKTWKHADQTLCVLLDLDAVSQSDVRSVLGEVDASSAKIELAGRVDGAVSGVATELELKGKYKYDFRLGRITSLVLLIKEKRSIGHVEAGMDVIAKLQMTVSPAKPARLADAAVKQVSFEPRANLTQLIYDSRSGGYQFLHDRKWYVNDDSRQVLRMVDRGELVAQCNISALAKTLPGKHLSLAQFQDDIKRALGKEFDQFLQASETNPEPGRTMYRVVASGKVADMTILRKYYLVADDQGNQVVFLFTVEDTLEERLGDADRIMVDSLRFTQPQVAENTAATR